MYKLKKGQETFTPVCGECEGITFVKGKEYREIPKEFSYRFEKVKPAKKEVKNEIDKSKS